MSVYYLGRRLLGYTDAGPHNPPLAGNDGIQPLLVPPGPQGQRRAGTIGVGLDMAHRRPHPSAGPRSAVSLALYANRLGYSTSDHGVLGTCPPQAS